MHNTKRDNKKIACVTMVRDEDTFLKIWYRYYSGLFGAENCFVIDHNSSTKKPRQILGNEQLSVITIPHESAINAKEGDVYAFDRERFKFISEFIKMLRLYYDIVIFNDADELFLPDPRKYTDLAQYLDKAPQDTVIAGVGIEVYHNLLNKEPAYNFEKKLFKQRANFVYRLHHSKPYIISTDCQIGGHGSTRPVLLDPDLILVHLKYLDASIMRERQALLYSLWQAKKVSDKTRWRFTENEIIDRLDNFARLPKKKGLSHWDLFESEIPDKIDSKFNICIRGNNSEQFFQVTDNLSAGGVRKLQEMRYVIDDHFLDLDI